MSSPEVSNLRRRGTGEQRASAIELFFDLVYVFAVTQLSHHLLQRPGVTGALQTALLLAMVWTAWVYTTWVTNWVDPDRIPSRLMLVGLMLVSLVMSAGLPQAFTVRGLQVGIGYAVMQIGRSAFAVWALRGTDLHRNFERILVWCVLSGAFAVAGGLSAGHIREALWITAVATDVLGGAVGFATPGLGRSTTDQWRIEGNHFAERCQAFVLIALGESVVVTGSTFAAIAHRSGTEVAAFAGSFAGVVALWWIYFDRAADDATDVVAASADPGRLGRSAYHFIHPVMVAGIIATAAADERVLSHPARVGEGSTTWMILGGVGLFLLGHAMFAATVWRSVPWTRLAAVVVLGLLAPVAPHISGLSLGLAAATWS